MKNCYILLQLILCQHLPPLRTHWYFLQEDLMPTAATKHPRGVKSAAPFFYKKLEGLLFCMSVMPSLSRSQMVILVPSFCLAKFRREWKEILFYSSMYQEKSKVSAHLGSHVWSVWLHMGEETHNACSFVHLNLEVQLIPNENHS